MSVLLAVVEAGSFSKASRRLGMPLATVSRKLSDLEAHLKTKLVNRSRRGLSMTEAGQAFVEASRRILETLEIAEREASGEYQSPRGELLMTAPIAFGRLHVLPIVLDFLASYPEIGVRLVQSDRMIQLADEHVVLGIRIGRLTDSPLIQHKVGSIRRIVCASPGYFEHCGHPAAPAELSGHDCIVFDGPMSADSWIFRQGGAERAIAVKSRLHVNTAEAAVDAAVAGLGLARVLAYQAHEALKSGALVLTLKEFEPEPSPVSIVHAGGRLQPLKVRAFVDFAAPRLKGLLASIAPA